MSHLGERVSSLVDGQLAIDAAERAHMHIAGCAECRQAVEVERLMKQRLAALGSVEPGGGLFSRLLELAGPCGPMPPPVGHVPGSPRPQLIGAGLGGAGFGDTGPGSPRLGDAGVAGVGFVSTEAMSGFGRKVGTHPLGRRGSSRPPTARRPGAVLRVSRSSRNRVAAAMVGAACLVGAGVAGGAVDGGIVAQQQVVPPVDSFVIQHSATSGSLPFEDQTVLWGTVGAGR